MFPNDECPPADVLHRSLDLDDPMSETERERIADHIDRCQQGCKQRIDALLRGNTIALAPDATPTAPAQAVAPVPGAIPSDKLNPPPAGVIDRDEQVGGRNLVLLLRKRLRFLLVVFAAYFLVILVLHVFVHFTTFTDRTDFWGSAVTFLACLGLAAVLSVRPGITLGQLRLIEFLLFAVFGLWMILRGHWILWKDTYYFGLVRSWAGGNDVAAARDMLTGVVYRLTAPSALFVVAYGVIIPNTWRRCALVVAAFTALPVVLWLAACTTHEVPVEQALSFQKIVGFLVVVMTAVLSVYGAYRIESSRQEAAEARRLGPYTLVRKLGAGGMGEVYLAQHRLLKRPCAVKLIRTDRAAADARLLDRFEREVQATAGLTHPNAVQVFDYGHTPEGVFYYAMEYLPGLTLQDLIERHGPLPPGRAVYLLSQVCGALREAHAAGLIHRDIKPGNVIVCDRGGTSDVAKLLDFGLVRDVSGGGAGLTQDGVVAGTPAYMAPEQARGAGVDARADIYAVGGLGYFLLTGRPAFSGSSAMHVVAAQLYESPTPPSRHRPDVPADLEAVVLRCLAKAPADRFTDVASLDTALYACACAGQWSPAEAAVWWRSQAGAGLPAG